MIRHLLTPIMGKLVKAFPNLKIDLQDYSPAHFPLPRVDVDIIFTGVAPLTTPSNDPFFSGFHPRAVCQ